MRNLVGRPKIGVLVNDLAASQLSYYLLKEADLNRGNTDIAIFQINQARPCIPVKAGLFNIGDAFGFTGPLIATSLETAEFLKQCFITKAKFFYVWDLFWTRLQYRDYNRLLSLFRGEARLIARSESHKSLIEAAWNNSIFKVTDNFQNIFDEAEIVKYAEASTFFIQS